MYMTRGGNNINYCPENQLTKNNVEQELGGPSNRGPSGLLSTLPALLLRRCKSCCATSD